MVEIQRQNTSKPINGTREIFTDVVWYSCAAHPQRCATDAITYESLPGHEVAHTMTSENAVRGNLVHSGGAAGQTLLAANRRYSVMISGWTHLAKMTFAVGTQLREGDWLEFESSSFPAYIRPIRPC